METSVQPPLARTPRNEEIPGLVEEQRASGLSIASFARERGLMPWKLYEATRTPKQRSKDDGGFDPVRVTGLSSPVIEVESRSGHVLRIPAGFDEETLRRLLAVLD